MRAEAISEATLEAVPGAVAPRGQHLAFEPNPRQARWLTRKFPEVEVRQLALDDSTGERPFHIHEERSGYSGFHPLGDPGETTRTVVTEVARLDDMIGPDHRVNFLKVVVEGAELSVLRGGNELLRRDRPFVLFECVPVHMERFGDTPTALFEFLTRRHSYELFLIKHVLDGGAPLDRAASLSRRLPAIRSRRPSTSPLPPR